jgi:hypothetical protein
MKEGLTQQLLDADLRDYLKKKKTMERTAI